MPSRIAKLHRPVVKLIGRRLAAAESPEQVRRVIKVTGALLAPCRGVVDEPIGLDRVTGLAVTPKSGATSGRTVLMFHGGGYVFGSPKMYRGLAGRIAKAAAATVYVPEYRLAPEHPHPAAIEDGLAAYRALIEQIPADHVVVGGDSAGGGLSLAVVQAARDAGLPLPAGMFLLSPWLDLRGPAVEHRNVDTELLIKPAIVDRASDWYRADRSADDPAISPILGGMAGLPPTLVQVTSSELLYGDSEAFVEQARAAGVDVTFEVADDLWHVWHLMAPALPEARASITSIGRFVVGCTT